MKFDIEEFNDNLTGHFMLDRIMLGKDSCRWRPWQLVYIRLVLTLRIIHFFVDAVHLCVCAHSQS